MAQHAQQSLPCRAFFFAQRLAEIGQHEQLMLLAAFAKRAATNVPASHLTGKDHLHRLWTTSKAKTRGKSELVGSAAEQARRLLGQQALPGTIHELQTLL